MNTPLFELWSVSGMPKQWKMQTPRLRCPHCGGTIFCTTNARWHIHGVGAPIDGKSRRATSSDSCEADENHVRVGTASESPKSMRATPQKPSLYSPNLARVAQDHAEGRSDKYGCNDEDPPDRDEGQERHDGA